MPVAPTAMEQNFVTTNPDVPVEIATQPPTGPDAGSYAELNERLGGILIQRGSDWFRKVPYHEGPGGIEEIDGRLVQKVLWQERGVALTKQGAHESTQSAIQGGRLSNDGKTLEFDWWDGRTWWRRGIKPELDIQIMRRQVLPVETTYEELDPATAASYQQMAAHREAVKPTVRRSRTQE